MDDLEGRSGTDPLCEGETLRFSSASPPASELRCPDLQYYSTDSRMDTNPAPEDQPCPSCIATAHSPGIIHIEIDTGWGATYDSATQTLTAPTKRLRGTTLKCDDVNYSIPETAFDPVPGARFTLINVPTQCTDAEQVSLQFAVETPSSAADAPYDAWLSVSSPVLQLSDADDDGILDDEDNCTRLPNAAQRDTDGDGHGNRCDADFNQDCMVVAIDLGIFKSVFFTADPDADLNGDGIVNAIDLGIFKSLLFGVPGPSPAGSLCNP